MSARSPTIPYLFTTKIHRRIELILSTFSRKPVHALLIAALVLLGGCFPKFDWREVRGSDAPYSVLMPAKPASLTQVIKLNQLDVSMQMSAADVDGISFAVGCVKIPDTSQADTILAAMKQGMLTNIHATVTKETQQNGDEIEASGQLPNGESVKLVARFVARQGWAYQVIMVGKAKAMKPEVIDTFMTSFKLP